MSAFCLYAACIKPAADKNARSNRPQKPSSGGYACNKIKSEYNMNVFSAGLLCLKYILQHAAFMNISVFAGSSGQKQNI